MDLTLDTHARMRAQMAALNLRHPATYVTAMVNADLPLLTLLQKKESEIVEMRAMFGEMKAMLRVMQTTQTTLMRALEVDYEAETTTDYIDEITSAGDFADESDDMKSARPTW